MPGDSLHYRNGYKARLYGLLLLISVGVITLAGSIDTASPNSSSNTVNNPAGAATAVSMDDFKKSSAAVEYDGLARNVDSLIGKKIVLKGTVV